MSDYNFKYVKRGQKRIPGEMETTIRNLSHNIEGTRKEIAALRARIAACNKLVNLAHKNEFMLLTKEDSYQTCSPRPLMAKQSTSESSSGTSLPPMGPKHRNHGKFS